MKSLEKATEDYEKAKARAESLQKRTEAAIRKMRECEAIKIEAENMEYARIIREMNLTVPELLDLQKQMAKDPTYQLDQYQEQEEQTEHEEMYGRENY